MVTTRGQTQNPTRGQKVNDPNATPIEEPRGAVASDSLAAESTRTGGKFKENHDSEPLGVSGSNSTFANENTSGAVRLSPTKDAEARIGPEETGVYPDALGGQAKDLAVESAQSSKQISGQKRQAEPAPTYVLSQYVDGGPPKGKNLKEGGFESNDKKNSSFNSEIGSNEDPGRFAEQKFARANAESAGDATIQKQNGVLVDNSFGALSGETST